MFFFYPKKHFCCPQKVTKFCSKKSPVCKKKENCFEEKTFFRKFFIKFCEDNY